MELKNIYGSVIFALEDAKTIFELVIAARVAGKSLSGANLYKANLREADLSWANLSEANLREANLSEAKNAALVFARLQFIPTEGAFIGWKKCRDGVIVKLEIQADSKRSHGSERKCRCSKAAVLAIYRADGVEIDLAKSECDEKFIYRVGQMVEPANGFDENRWKTCGAGIHFYLTREEAEAHV